MPECYDAEFHLCRAPCVLSGMNKPFMLTVIMLSAIMLIVIMLSVIMLSVVTPLRDVLVNVSLFLKYF